MGKAVAVIGTFDLMSQVVQQINVSGLGASASGGAGVI